jgi:hypothetical protein
MYSHEFQSIPHLNSRFNIVLISTTSVVSRACVSCGGDVRCSRAEASLPGSEWAPSKSESSWPVLQPECKYIDLLSPNKLHKLQVCYAGQTRAQLRISKLLPKSRLTRRLPSTGFAKHVSRVGVQRRVCKDPHTNEGGTPSSLLCVGSHDLIPCYEL